MTNQVNFHSIIENQSIDERFENLTRYTDMVINDIQPSLILTGGPGTGKTYTVKERIKEHGLQHGLQWLHIKGRSSAAGLYVTLYQNSDKLLVLDDCDAVFKDDDAVNLLKAALDSYDERVISYISAKPLKDNAGDPIPTSFVFTGKIIFISNLDESKIDDAVKSRSFTFNIDIKPEQMLQRMENLLPSIEPNINMNLKKEALRALQESSSKFSGIELNMRSLIKAIRIRQMNFPKWQYMIVEQCINNSKAGKIHNTKNIISTDHPEKNNIINDRNNGMAINKIADKYNIGGHQVRKILNLI